MFFKSRGSEIQDTLFHALYKLTVQLAYKTAWFQIVLCTFQPLKSVSNEHGHHMCFISEQRLSCLSQTSRRRDYTDSSQSKIKPTGVEREGGTVERSLTANLLRPSGLQGVSDHFQGGFGNCKLRPKACSVSTLRWGYGPSTWIFMSVETSKVYY